MIRRVSKRLREQRGYTLVELITAMGILGIVMSSLVVVMASATRAELEMNNQFQAQTQARTALERFRREGHAACKASPTGATGSITLTYITSGSCPETGGNQVTWCTVAVTSGRYGLHRSAGTSCNGTNAKIADYLTVGDAFDYQTTVAQRAKIAITLSVDTDLRDARAYLLSDHVVLRNSKRPAA